MAAQIDDGIVRGKMSGEDVALGLQNLAQLCHQIPQGEWQRTVTEHFDSFAETKRQEQELDQKMGNFSEIKELLAVRIWPREYLEQLGTKKLIFREDLEGTISAIVFDLPKAIKNVTPEQAKLWNKADDELFAIGLENIRKKAEVEITRQEAGGGLSFIGLTGNNFLSASHVLLLDQQPQCVGKYGAIVGIPTRHIVLCYPIENLEVARIIQKMIPVIISLEKEGPGSISPELFWYRNGKFTRLPYRLSSKELSFIPPDEFVDLLNKLPKPAAGN